MFHVIATHSNIAVSYAVENETTGEIVAGWFTGPDAVRDAQDACQALNVESCLDAGVPGNLVDFLNEGLVWSDALGKMMARSIDAFDGERAYWSEAAVAYVCIPGSEETA